MILLLSALAFDRTARYRVTASIEAILPFALRRRRR